MEKIVIMLILLAAGMIPFLGTLLKRKTSAARQMMRLLGMRRSSYRNQYYGGQGARFRRRHPPKQHK